MRFPEKERLAVAFVNEKELVGGGKLILKAAQATQVFFNERLKADGASIEKGAVFGNPKITAMLANDNLSPDYMFSTLRTLPPLIYSTSVFREAVEKENPKARKSQYWS